MGGLGLGHTCDSQRAVTGPVPSRVTLSRPQWGDRAPAQCQAGQRKVPESLRFGRGCEVGLVTLVETGLSLCVCAWFPTHWLLSCQQPHPAQNNGEEPPSQLGRACPCLRGCSPASAGDKHLSVLVPMPAWASDMAQKLPEAQGGSGLRERVGFQTFPGTPQDQAGKHCLPLSSVPCRVWAPTASWDLRSRRPRLFWESGCSYRTRYTRSGTGKGFQNWGWNNRAGPTVRRAGHVLAECPAVLPSP